MPCKDLGVFVSMLAIAGLAACGSSGGSSTSSNGKVTLTLFQCQTCVPFAWQISAFEKAYPKITINVESVPFGEFYTKTAVLAASSSPPDLYTVDQPTIANLAAGNVIQPLNKYLAPSYVQSLTSAARADFTYNGKLLLTGADPYIPGAVLQSDPTEQGRDHRADLAVERVDLAASSRGHEKCQKSRVHAGEHSLGPGANHVR